METAKGKGEESKDYSRILEAAILDRDERLKRATDRTALLFGTGIDLEQRTMILGVPYMQFNPNNEVSFPMSANFFVGLDALERCYVPRIGGDPNHPITIDLTSYGGDIYLSLGIYDRIKMCKVPVRIRAFGACMSGGSIILQAGSERLMSPQARLMLHYGFTGDEGTSLPRRLDENLRNHHELMDSLVAIYMEKCQDNYGEFAKDMKVHLLADLLKINPKGTRTLKSFFAKASKKAMAERMLRENILPIETYLDPETCLRYGLIDSIIGSPKRKKK